MRHWNTAWSAAVAAAVVLSACSSRSDVSTASPTTTEASTASTTAERTGSSTTAERAGSTTSVAVEPTGSPASDRELEALLVTNVPAGFELQPDDVGDTGPSDLAKAVRDDPTDGVEEALRKEGFVRGYQRLWVGPDDAELIVFLYQFKSVAGAQAEFDRSRANVVEQAPPGFSRFSVEGLPEETTLGLTATSEDGAAAVVLLTSGVFVVQVVSNAASAAGLRERASAIAKDQQARL